MLLPLLIACHEAAESPRALTEAVGTPAEAAVVWGGFSQVWGYNHRINSLGDHVGPLGCDDEGCAAVLTHAAASGSGSDTATWTSRYSAVEAPGVGFLGGSTRLVLDEEDAEGELLTLATEVVLPDAPAGDELHALLNGFDLQATDDPDKLEHLTITVGEPYVADAAVRLPIDVAIQLDCDSVECDGTLQLDRSVHYEILVSWLVVAADDGDLAVTPTRATHAYAWRNGSLDDELQLPDLVTSADVNGERGFDEGFLAVTGLSVDLDRDHHMAEWATAVEPGRYDRANGAIAYDATLAFKQWNAGTWWNPVSYTSPGTGAVELDLALVQLRDACVRTGVVSGSLTWKADGAPSTDDAVQTRSIPTGCR